MTVLAIAENSIQLIPDGTVFLHIGIILVMVFLLNRTLFKPISRVLEERERRTVGQTGKAQEILHSVEEGLTRYERTLREARADGYRLLERERAEAMLTRQNKVEGVRNDASKLVEDQKRALRGQTEDARELIGQDARRIAATVSAQILGRTLNDTSAVQ